MKILSLNTDWFRNGTRSGDPEKYLEIDQDWATCERIVEYVASFLEEEDTIAVLQEVPYTESPIKKGKKSDYHKEFIRALVEKGCQPLMPIPGQNALACTMAVVRQNAGEGNWICRECKLGKEQMNRYVELEHKKLGLRILGIHAPDGMEFLNNIVKKYAREHKDEKAIILGDFNIATNPWRREQMKNVSAFMDRMEWFDVVTSEDGYTDAVGEDDITYFTQKTCIDHVLVSPGLAAKASVTATVMGEPKLSDHAAIIVNVEGV